MSFISLTVTVKHVVGGRNKQVLPQWICLWCNIQFDNMGSVIFFECRVARVLRFYSSRLYWDSHNPSPVCECAPPPPPGSGGRGTLAGKRGVGRVPFPTRGYTQLHTLWYSLRTLWQGRTSGNTVYKIQMKIQKGDPYSYRYLAFNQKQLQCSLLQPDIFKISIIY